MGPHAFGLGWRRVMTRLEKQRPQNRQASSSTRMPRPIFHEFILKIVIVIIMVVVVVILAPIIVIVMIINRNSNEQNSNENNGSNHNRPDQPMI